MSLLDIPCLGRPFGLGMLYDCRSDCLVPGVTLWDSSMLQQATEQRPQSGSNFELIPEDSFASKTLRLGMQTNSMKLSFLTGLINTAGSAKFLDDQKSSNKQARVTLKYGSTTRLEELTVEKLGSAHRPTVSGKATHIVTSVLYGAEAFFVFDQEVAPSENYQTVHDNMKRVIQGLPHSVAVGDMTKVQCRVYCDFQLPENPTSFQDAARVLKELPKLVESSSSVVPKRVTLYPLNKLDSSAARIPHEISPSLLKEVESFVELFHKLLMQCNDLMKTEVSSNFPAIQKQLSCFRETINLYKSNMTKQLADLLPRVRGGKSQEGDMSKIFEASDISPFKSQRLLSWLHKKEREINMLAGYLNSMKEIPFVASPNELDAIVYNVDYDSVLCFSFLVAGDDPYLQYLSDYIRTPQVKGDDALPQQWHEDRAVLRDMRSQAKQFKDFVEANKMQQDTKFIVSSCVNLENAGNKGAMTVLFKDGLSETFLPPSQPGKATSTKVTNDSILLTWSTPKSGAESVLSYTISYYMENDPNKQWKTCKTQDSGNTIMVTQLTPKTSYRFKVHAQCEAGVSPESEISDPIETSPNYSISTANQPGDVTQVTTTKPVLSYAPISSFKEPISRPGQPNPSKVTSNTVHLNWNTPESGTQSINFYAVLYRRMDDLSAQWETVKTQGAQEFAKVSGLTANAVYCFKVHAECEAGIGPDSELSDPIQTTPPPVPGRPGKPTVSKVTHNSIHLKWPGPKSGIEGVRMYSVICRRMDDPSAQWQTTKTQDSQKELTVSGLAAKAVYCFKVRAESEAGVSPNSELSDPIATSPPPAPGRPGKPTVSKAIHNSIHLNWSAPDSGIEGVKFYSVLYRRMDDPSAQWQTTKTQDSQNEVTVSGLATKAVYCFKVCAECEGGVSPDSELSDPVATSSPPVPGRPGKPTVSKVTHNSIHLNWPGPKSGIEGVTFYSVLYRRMDNTLAEWQTTKTQDSQNEVTVCGLAAKAIYCFKVCAESETGVSPESEMCDPVATTSPPAPGRPGKPTASKVTHNSIHLNWPGPDSGIEGVKFYSVLNRRMDDPSAQWQTTKTQDSQKELMVSGLVAKAVYCFKVCAESEAGVSPDSEISDPTATSPPPVSGRPGKPTAAKVTDNSVVLHWPGPKSGIDSIEYYTVLYHQADAPSLQWQSEKTKDTQMEATISGLKPKVVYCFKVCAESATGTSPESEITEIETKNTPIYMPERPGKPMASKVTHNSVHLNWSVLESGTGSIKFFCVSYRRVDDPSAQWQTMKTQDSQNEVTVSGLAAKAVYCFKVRAESEAGVSPDSEMSEPILTNLPPVAGRPGKPTASKVTHNSIHLNWPGPKSGIEGVKFYSVSYRRMDDPSAQWQTTKTQDPQNEVIVSGLVPQAVYCLKVLAESDAGVSPDSELSDPIRTNPPPVPGRPGKPTASNVTHNSIHLNWRGPDLEGVKLYSVFYRRMDDPSAQWQTTKTPDSQSEVAVSGLVAQAVYCFKVRAEGEAGDGPESEMCDPIRTNPPPVAERPGKPTASKVTHNSIHLNWPGPKSGIDGVEFYSVIYRRMDVPSAQWQTTMTQDSQKELTLSGLVANGVYCFKVRAECNAGVSPDSELSEPTQTSPPPLPGRPGKPMASKVSHNSVVLNWSRPETFAQGIKHYLVSYHRANDPSSRWQTLKTQDSQEFITVSELAAKAVYDFKVCTECETGHGPESKISQIKTSSLPIPSPPGKPNAFEVSHNAVKLDWSHPQHRAENVEYYTVSYCKTNGPTKHWGEKQTDGATASLTVDNLDAKTKYCFKVRADSEAGVSNWSEVSPAIQTRSRPPPSQPGKPSSLNVNHDTVVLKWKKPEHRAKDVNYYTVSYYVVDDHNSPVKSKTKKTAGRQESVSVSGLQPRAIYCFNVCAESDAGCSSSSESSDPIQLHAPPAPSQPGKPTAFDDDIIHDRILLNWAKPTQSGDYVKRYCISYRRRYDPVDQWQTKLSDGARTALTVSGLDPKSQYSFKVHAVSDTGISVDSEISVFYTKAKVRLAEGMLSSAVLIDNGPPKVYKLRLQEATVDEDNQLKRCAIGKPDSVNKPEEKVIMVLGATGAGKTTLINGMTNYLLGVEWGDEFRFKLIVDEVDPKASKETAQAESQTKWITAYTFHHQKGSPLPYTLTIIDTPGFGDTGGLQRDHRITAQIKGLFSMAPPNCIDHLNAIGFVTTASLARLTPTQKYIFDSILAIFGKDIASNIFMMATFADGGVPPVVAAIKAADIPSCDIFKFNNSSLLANPTDTFGEMFWKMGLKSFEDFFAHLKTVQARSLILTREVLDEREHLEVVIQGLLPQIQIVMSKMDEMQQEEKVLERLQVEADDLQTTNFKYTVKVVDQKKVDLDPGEFVTNCIQCNFTCHHPCGIANDDEKWGCAAMNWPAAGEESVCGVCTGKCEWQKHFNMPYRIESCERDEERTLDDLLKKFETVKSDKNAVKNTVEKIKKTVLDLQAMVFEMICEAQQILARLDEIALKPNPLTELDYIDLLIESEKQQCKPGYMKRLEYFQDARKNANLIHQLNKGGDAPQWLKDAAAKAKANMQKHIRDFQNPQHVRVVPTPLRADAPPPPAQPKQEKGRGYRWGWPFK